MIPSLVLRIGGVIDDTRFGVAALDGIVVTRDYGIASRVGHEWSPAAKAFASALRTALHAHADSRPEIAGCGAGR